MRELPKVKVVPGRAGRCLIGCPAGARRSRAQAVPGPAYWPDLIRVQLRVISRWTFGGNSADT